jgi:GTPase involved in cell partitioning and DNA repair
LLDGTKILEDVTAPSAPSAEELDSAAGSIGEFNSASRSSDGFETVINQLIHRYQAIRNELGLYNEQLLHKPEIVVLNKIDVLESDPLLLEKAKIALRQRIASIRGTHPLPHEPYLISAVSGKGIQEMLFAIYAELVEKFEYSHLKTEKIELPDSERIRTRNKEKAEG